MTKPEKPSDPRDGEPYYIDSECPDCGTELILYQELEDAEYDEDEIWHDEWTCPKCEDGIYLDWPEEAFERLKEGSAGTHLTQLDTDE